MKMTSAKFLVPFYQYSVNSEKLYFKLVTLKVCFTHTNFILYLLRIRHTQIMVPD